MEKKKGKRKKVIYDSIVEGFTLLPPEEDIPIEDLKNQFAYITEIDMLKDKKRTETMINLKCNYSAFKKTRNPVYALMAFQEAHEAGIYPPLWVLDFLAKEIKEANHQLFNFKISSGRGETNYLDIVDLERRNGNLMYHMVKLETIFGCKVHEAVEMVHKRFCCRNNTCMIGSGQLKKIHSRLHSSYSCLYEFFKEKASEWTDKDKKNYLKNYGRETIPERLHYLIKDTCQK